MQNSVVNDLAATTYAINKRELLFNVRRAFQTFRTSNNYTTTTYVGQLRRRTQTRRIIVIKSVQFVPTIFTITISILRLQLKGYYAFPILNEIKSANSNVLFTTKLIYGFYEIIYTLLISLNAKRLSLQQSLLNTIILAT